MSKEDAAGSVAPITRRPHTRLVRGRLLRRPVMRADIETARQVVGPPEQTASQLRVVCSNGDRLEQSAR
jgi:hypothetical protein